MTVTRTFDLLDRYQQNFQKETALAIKNKGRWKHFSTEEYLQKCNVLAYGLLEMGLKKGEKIITVTNNRPEWNFIDHGMSMCGIIHVPVYASLNEEEYTYIIKHSDAKMAFVSDKKMYDLLLPACKNAGIENYLFSFDELKDIQNWKLILEKGNSSSKKWDIQLEKIKASIDAKDPATLIYTSGTTGKPKGVLLSHENLTKNFVAAAKVFKLTPDDKYLSILPLCHVGGRLGNYQTQYSGASIYYAESMGTFVSALKEIQANGFDAVPRIMEKVYENVIAKGKQLKGIKKKLFFWAVSLGFKYNVYNRNGWWYRKRLAFADKVIFTKWREALGGKVRLVGCGGASLQPRLERLFWAAGVKIINMYGLTETSPIITISSQDKGKIKLGSTGIPIDGVELKIADDGEILTRGHNVMIEYYKDPELTENVFDKDGWFHTGDIGHIEDGKFLVVTDRKKEIFKLSNGKFIAPQYLENLFKQSPLIDQLMVLGESQKFTSAIISPDFEQLGKWADNNNVAFSNREELICMPEVQMHFQKEIIGVNEALSEHERLNRFRLIPDSWTPESGELSPTLKLKRKIVSDKYKVLIDTIY